MTAEQAITSLDGMTGKIGALLAGLERARKQAGAQWEGLGKAGGQRADHPAALLEDIKRELRALRLFAQTCEHQIDALQRNPFGH